LRVIDGFEGIVGSGWSDLVGCGWPRRSI